MFLWLLFFGYFFQFSSGTACDAGWRNFSNACYHTIEGYTTYQTANGICTFNGAYVVTVHSPQEQAFVDGLFNPKRAYWIGLEGNSSGWFWVDGGIFSYHYFRGGAVPAPSTNCVMAGFQVQYDGRWDVVPCNTRASYQGVICKKYLVQPTTTTATPPTPTPPPRCVLDVDCGNWSLVCRHGRCLTYCLTAADCPVPGHQCIQNACQQNCTTNLQCSHTEVCSGGVCIPACASDSDCPAGQQCVAGHCVTPSCTTDGVCGWDRLCQLEECAFPHNNATCLWNGPDSDCPATPKTTDDGLECRLSMCGWPTTKCVSPGDTTGCPSGRICSRDVCVRTTALVECATGNHALCRALNGDRWCMGPAIGQHYCVLMP